jgi:hypothetical protein
MSGRYAVSGVPQTLPRPAATRPSLYSVPRPDGGFDYYRAPEGSRPPQNDDFPAPTVAHPNDLGVSSLTMGRPLPPGSVRVGSGSEAKGSITPMPGVRADGPLVSGLGAALGAVGSGEASPQAQAIAVVAAAALFTAAAVWYQRREG